jgi:hypothetical protein
VLLYYGIDVIVSFLAVHLPNFFPFPAQFGLFYDLSSAPKPEIGKSLLGKVSIS